MGDEEPIDNRTKEQMLQDEIQHLYERMDEQKTRMDRLLMYLERTDKNFELDLANFDNWDSRLDAMLQEERKQEEIRHAKRVLEREGYLVAKDANGMDMAKVKAWASTGVHDDDIPF